MQRSKRSLFKYHLTTFNFILLPDWVLTSSGQCVQCVRTVSPLELGGYNTDVIHYGGGATSISDGIFRFKNFSIKLVLPMPLTGDKQIYSRYRSLPAGQPTDRGVNKAVRGKRWFPEALSLNITLTKKSYNNYNCYLQIYQQAHGFPYIVYLIFYISFVSRGTSH